MPGEWFPKLRARRGINRRQPDHDVSEQPHLGWPRAVAYAAGVLDQLETTDHAVLHQGRPPDRVVLGIARDELRRGTDWTDEVANGRFLRKVRLTTVSREF